jgi:hypothetical protein
VIDSIKPMQSPLASAAKFGKLGATNGVEASSSRLADRRTASGKNYDGLERRSGEERRDEQDEVILGSEWVGDERTGDQPSLEDMMDVVDISSGARAVVAKQLIGDGYSNSAICGLLDELGVSDMAAPNADIDHAPIEATDAMEISAVSAHGRAANAYASRQQASGGTREGLMPGVIYSKQM